MNWLVNTNMYFNILYAWLKYTGIVKTSQKNNNEWNITCAGGCIDVVSAEVETEILYSKFWHIANIDWPFCEHTALVAVMPHRTAAATWCQQ